MEKERYFSFSRFLNERYGTRVWRISVDGGFSCPNLDGTLSKEGCIFCNNKAFSASDATVDIDEQIKFGMEFTRKRYRAEKFILYYQCYSSTYGNLTSLKKRYDLVKRYSDFVTLAVSTRPDAIDENKADLLASYIKDVDVWIELGLQTIHDKTLVEINRGHDFKTFLDAVDILQNKHIEIFVHVILGLPGETEEMMIETARTLSALPIRGIKIHPLHVVKNTKLNDMYTSGKYTPMESDEYLNYLVAFIEHLRPDIVIARFTADVKGNLLVAPEWIKNKPELILSFRRLLERLDTSQGAKHY